jgi:hypothetical protein
MLRVGFEPKTPIFERAKMVHALDRAAFMIGIQRYVTELMTPSLNKQTQNKADSKGF